MQKLKIAEDTKYVIMSYYSRINDFIKEYGGYTDDDLDIMYSDIWKTIHNVTTELKSDIAQEYLTPYNKLVYEKELNNWRAKKPLRHLLVYNYMAHNAEAAERYENLVTYMESLSINLQKNVQWRTTVKHDSLLSVDDLVEFVFGFDN